MKITEALKITQSVAGDVRRFAVTLACGFTPLHLQTFLAAHLQQSLPGRRVAISSGLYGDLPGTIEAINDAALPDGVVIALEWADLDARLDYRSAGSWGRAAMDDIVASGRGVLDRLGAALMRIPAGPRVALSLPTLAIASAISRPRMASVATRDGAAREYCASSRRNLRRTDASRSSRAAVAEGSPAGERLDLKSDLYTGLPYTIEHADRLASQLALALAPPAPKKGIISDLDDTLWSGIVGEVGPDAVSWDLASHAQLHGLVSEAVGVVGGVRHADCSREQERSGSGGEGFRAQGPAAPPGAGVSLSRCIGTRSRAVWDASWRRGTSARRA